MDRHSEQAHHFKRVALPSGKTIEVLYFGEAQPGEVQTPVEALAERAPAAEPSSQAPAAGQAPVKPDQDLHVCQDCDAELIYPDRWEEAGPHAWRVTLVCPNCGSERRGVFGDEAVEALDEALDRGTDALARDYKALMRANMVGEVERFIAALDADAIQPMDF
jgi:hypothetical protein